MESFRASHREHRRWRHVAVVGLIAMAWTGSVHGQLITENAGFKTGIDTWVVGEWFTAYESKNVTSFRLDHRFLFRFDEKTEFRIEVPTILSKEVTFIDPLGRRQTRTLSGLGDVKFVAKHSLRQTDDVMWSNRWALLGEVTGPTGQNDDKSGGFEIPRRLQLGTGSWGFGGGTALTFIRDRHRFSSEWMFRHWLRHDGFRPGQSVHWNMSYWYRLYPAQFDAEKVQRELRGVVELLNTYHFDSKLGSRNMGDHGVESWVALGFNWFLSRNVLFDVGFQVPTVETVNDEFGDRRWQAMVGLRILFERW